MKRIFKVNRTVMFVLTGFILFFNFAVSYGDDKVSMRTGLADNMQQITVSGTITDENSAPLPGVNITVEGTIIGTISDVSGKYTLNITDRNAVLVFTFVGYASQKVNIGGRAAIDVQMMPDLLNLDEVVVIGYGTMKKSDLTGSVESIDMGDLPPSASTNLAQSLRGFAAGLNVQGGGSTAGAEPSFTIRGQNTLSASQNPLIVLDGIIYHGSLSDVNVADIERIDVLKDASASAIYGARASNGVIIVTTKKGKEGKPTMNFNTYYGFQDMTNNPVTVMNAEQYVRKQIDFPYMQKLYTWYNKRPTSVTDQGGRPVYTDVLTDELVLQVLRSETEKDAYLEGYETDWVNEVTRIAPIANYELSVSGGSDNYNYYVSGSYIDQKGVLVNDQFNRSTFFGKVEGKVLDWVTLGLTTSISNRDNSGIPATLSYARNTTPLSKKYNEFGEYPQLYNNEFLMSHPLRAELVPNQDLSKNIFASFVGKVEIPGIKGLTYEFNYSENYTSRDNRTYYPKKVEEGASYNGRAVISINNSQNWLFNNILSYSNEFSGVHRVNGTLVYTREKTFGRSSGIDGSNFSSELLGYNDMGFAGQVTTDSGAWDENSLAYMARLSYIYNDRYFLTGTYRRDGYSGFGADKKLADFPSLSLAWAISEESFIQSAEWLDFLKLRLSYGENGNQGIGRYSSLSTIGTLYYAFGSGTAIGVGPSALGNANLGWETTRSINIGLDYAVLKNRISGEINVYNSNTEDVLVRQSLPLSTGFTSVWSNIGQINNKGIELELNTINLEGDFRWESRFVFSLNRDKIMDLYGDDKDDIGNSWFIGEPITAIYDYKRTGGVWTEEELFSGAIHSSFNPGQFRIEDIDGSNSITPDKDRQIVGYRTPNYRFSINNNFDYKNFNLSIFINSIQGGNGYFIQNNRGLLEATSDFDYANRINMPSIRTNWTPFNGVTDAPAIYNYPPVASGNYQDRSFVRLQDVSLSYRFSQSLLNKLHLQSLQVYVSGKNLYTWTKWQGYDPEGGVSESYGGGFNSSTDMQMRSIIMGVRIGL